MSSGLPVSFTIVMVFVFAVIGFFAGRAVSLMVYKRRYAEKEALLKSSGITPAADQPAPLADPAKYTELLRLWRDKSSGALFVETSGHLLASSGPLNPNQKKRFIDLIKELAVWTGIPATVVVPAAVEPESKPASVPVATVPNPVPSVNNRSEMMTAAAPVKTDPLPVVPQPSMMPSIPAPVVGVQPATPPPPYMAAAPIPVSKPASEPVKKAVSMVEQIDEILQEIIQRSDNPNRRIRLVEERNQGVIVWVDQEHFSGIDAVTNDSARELIRAAAKEWERRSETRL